MEKDIEAAPAAAVARLTVCALSGRTIHLDVEAGQSIIALRSQLADAFGIAPFRIQLAREDASVLEDLGTLACEEQLTLLAMEPPLAINVFEERTCEKVREHGRSIDALASTCAGGFGFYTWEAPQDYISPSQGHVESLRAILGLLNTDEIGDGGGCSHIGKMLFSTAADRTAIGVVTYVPANLVEKVSATEWTQHVLNALGVRAGFVSGCHQHPWVWSCRTDAAITLTPDMVTPATAKDAHHHYQFGAGFVQHAISSAVDWLRRRGVVEDDDGDDPLFGDDALE